MAKAAQRPLWALAMWSSLALSLLLVMAQSVAAHEVSDFFGRYTGTVELIHADGAADRRDVTVEISATDRGFRVHWGSVSEKEDGRRKEKFYEVEFLPSGRSGIFAAAMQRNVFGHEVQQDPMKGRPYVWARLVGDTLTVFSMFIDQNGDYEMQQYDRSLTAEGLHLTFKSHRNGLPLRSLEAELLRQ